MSYYRTAQICLKGHLISDSADTFPDEQLKFCKRCGKETFMNCPACSEPIHGVTDSQPDYKNYSIPFYCHNCGKPYPWTSYALEQVLSSINNDPSVDLQTLQELTESLPEIMSESPSTTIATSRIKKGLLACGKFTAEGIRQFAIDFGCELAKRQLGL